MSDDELPRAFAGLDPGLPTVLITLLKGVAYRDQDLKLWTMLLRLQSQATHSLYALGLVLTVDEVEGHAYLRSRDAAQSEEDQIPRLIARRPLTFYDSLLLALLRKRLAEFERSETESRLTLSSEQIVELVAFFLPEHTDEAKLRERVAASTSRLQEMGFLRKLKTSGDDETFEVLRIIKAFVDAQWLSGFEEGLAKYRTHFQDSQTT